MKEPEFTVKPVALEEDFHQKKVDFIIEKLQGPGDYIVFSDVDIIVKSDIFRNLKQHIDNEETMVFLRDGEKLSSSFMLLKVCPEVLEFWNHVKLGISIDELIVSYTGKWSKLDSQKFTSSNSWNMQQQFCIMKPLTSSLGDEFDFAEKMFCMAQHIELEKYMKYVPENIIPFIYKFQEILYLSHKESNAGKN